MPTRLVRRAASPALLLGALAGAATGCGQTDVTKTRLERSVAPNFAHQYVAQSSILGHPGATVAGTHAVASCDRGGPKVPDRGAGPNWICTIDFDDVAGAHQQGRFEVTVSSDSCYVVGGPSKLVGTAKITDASGHDVTNPPAEFEGCFDPAG